MSVIDLIDKEKLKFLIPTKKEFETETLKIGKATVIIRKYQMESLVKQFGIPREVFENAIADAVKNATKIDDGDNGSTMIEIVPSDSVE
jgi:hypothetical protein